MISIVSLILRNAASRVPPFFAQRSDDVASQLQTIAKLVESRAQTGLRRQVFFVLQTGYDTQLSQLGLQQVLLSNLS